VDQVAELQSCIRDLLSLLALPSIWSGREDEFLAMLGHELRNPLSPIVSALELLKNREAKSKEVVIIERQLQRVLNLVDDLLITALP
jgi:signal transduction histidine kinase